MASYDTQTSPPDPVTPPVITTGVPPSVHLSLTIGYTTLYSFLFLVVYAQLWLILYYKHKRFSYQTCFLFLCLIWSGIRTSLFSFYFRNCSLANSLGTFSYWLLYCFPVCLQFITLCLLVLYFAQVVFKVRPKCETVKERLILKVCLVIAMVIFIGTNVTCAIIVRRDQDKSVQVAVIRVAINDTLFIACGIVLSVCLYKVSRLPPSHLLLETRGTTVCQAKTACILIILLYTSRAVYNVIAILPSTQIIEFGLGWINVSDQADIINLNKGFAYVSFGIVLFVWEFLPTFILVLLFRVKRPTQTNNLVISCTANHPHNSRAYFFDDHRRYDSDDDLSRHLSTNARGIAGTINNADDEPFNISTHGSTPRSIQGSLVPGPRAADTSVMHSATNQPFYDGT